MQSFLNKIFPAIQNLESYERVINRLITILTLGCLFFSIVAMSVTYYNFSKKEQTADRELLINANSILQSNISEQLSIIANNQDFVSYLREGQYSKALNVVSIMLLFQNFVDHNLIQGVQVVDKSGNQILNIGNENTSFYVNLKLCYLNSQINNEFGNCNNQVRVFMSPNTYLVGITKINSNIRPCDTNNCTSFKPLENSKFGSFLISTASDTSIPIKYSSFNSYQIFLPSIIIFIILISGLLVTQRIIKHLTQRYLAAPIQKIETNLRANQPLGNNYISEINYLAKEIKEYQDHKFEIKMGKNLAQVAHDIRSPLAALNIGLKHLPQVPEEQRILLRNAANRINDIANNLLLQYKNKGVETAQASHHLHIWLLAPLIESMVSEKRVQLEEQPIQLETEITSTGFAAFARFDGNEMKRLLSNLINNAAEAFAATGGKITVGLDADATLIYLSVMDNGMGIPADKLAAVLEPGVSFKEKGTGLGLPHAKATIENWGGNLKLNSVVNEGTRIDITLPRADAPSWFVSEIRVSPEIPIGILDDDQSVHDAWDQRLLAVSRDLTIQHFKTPLTFREWYQNVEGNVQVFSDYELLGETETGLDVLEALKLKNAILVTSHYENPEIIRRCQALSIRLLPKNLLAHVLIQKAETETEKDKIDLVLIDDDAMLRQAWEMTAEFNDKHILSFESISAFEKALPTLDPKTPIYIDSELGEDIKGEEYAKVLFEQGFGEIYLATGHPPSHFGPMPWIRAVVQKTPPF